MMERKVKIKVIDPDASQEVEVGVSPAWKIEKFVNEVARKLNIPFVDDNGNPVSYEAFSKRTNTLLDPYETVQQADIQEGDVIRLRAIQEGG